MNYSGRKTAQTRKENTMSISTVGAAARKTRHTVECKIDHMNRAIILTRRFATAASVYGTKEFSELMKIRQAFPDFEVQTRTAKRTANTNSAKGLTMAFMENHVKILHEEDFAEFESKKLFSRAYTNPYNYMKNWFTKKYPNWNSNELSQKEA
jgi:transcriptional regulator of heat shock response